MHRALRSSLAACLLIATPGLPVQAQGPGQSTTTAELADLGSPAPLPDGAPPHLGLIERDGLRRHAMWLASDERGGRFTTSKGQQDTVKYIAEHFQRLGLKPLGDRKGFVQHYPLQRTFLDAAGTSLSFADERITDGLAVLPSSPGDRVNIAGRFAWCGNGSPDQLAKGGLKGRIPVVVLDRAPRGAAGTAVADAAALNRVADIGRKLAAEGAAAAVVGLLDDQGAFANTLNYGGLLPDHPVLQFEGKGRDAAKTSIPLLFLDRRNTERLRQALGRGEESAGDTEPKLSGRLQITVKADTKANGSNVVALLEGRSRKQEAVVFSAHHDHIGVRLDGDPFNGADDNASGTAGLLEIAEAFAKGPQRPERSVIFLSVSGEELGLWGSEYFAKNPTWPLDRIAANVNIDMIGRAGSDGDLTVIGVTPSPGHAAFSTMVRDAIGLAERMGIRCTSADTYYQRSDHYNFATRGIPVVFFCDGEHPDYHQVTDHADKLDYPRMEAVARLAFWTGWLVGEARERPKELGAGGGR